MRGRTRRQYSASTKNTRACRRARGMGHLSLTTERNLDLCIITHGTVVENRKRGAPRRRLWRRGTHVPRGWRGACRALPDPDRSSLETVPASTHVPGGGMEVAYTCADDL